MRFRLRLARDAASRFGARERLGQSLPPLLRPTLLSRIGGCQVLYCFWVAQRLRRCDKVSGLYAASAAEVHFVAAPRRGNTGYGCYFITASTFQKRNILQSERMGGLLVKVLLHYRRQERFLLHEFAVMPDHFHLLITPRESLERAMQLIKGGFSFRAKKELGFVHEIWQSSYYDRRVRDAEEYFSFRDYIRKNAVKGGLVVEPKEYRYSSARPGLLLDAPPESLRFGMSA